MTPSDISQKLDLIRGLSREEIEGWRGQISATLGRPFNEEIAALAAREKQLNREGR
ncbi:hypothetical protein [Roseovarius mucosus]|uniref:hypothetical protein n=1 Tax=Roseovarius mucosus TaxID=215743 RepID=UPI0035CF7CAB